MFSELERWDPQSYHKIQWYWNDELLQPTGSFLDVRKDKVDRNKYNFSDLQPITIHFDGSIDKRKIDAGREYTMDLYHAKPGDIIVAKIDLKNGAVAIVPEDWGNVVVTNHFAVYKPNLKKIIPAYFHLLIQTCFFKRYLWQNKVGAEGRKEVKLEFFENILIPTPPLPIQQKIVNYLHEEQRKSQGIRNQAKCFANEKFNELLKHCKLHVMEPTPQKGAFSLSWMDFYRWDTFFYRKDFYDLEEQLENTACDELGNALNFISRPWSTQDFPNGDFKYIEISSVDKEHGITGSRTVSVKKAPSRATTLVKQGDIILSTTRPYLGAFAIVPPEYDNYVCTSGFAVADRLKSKRIDKEFLLYFLKSDAGLRQMERFMTGGLYPAIVQSELEKIKIPIPDLKIQKQIVKIIRKTEHQTNKKLTDAVQRFKRVKHNIEEMVLGRKNVVGVI
jgi:type I restriction enzyme S subunit